mgnify:FL=1
MEQDHRGSRRPRFLRGGPRKDRPQEQRQGQGQGQGQAIDAAVPAPQAQKGSPPPPRKNNFFQRRPRREEPAKASATVQDQIVPVPSSDDFLFLPLGGSGEIGMNVNLYGTNKQWIIIDMGISFGDGDSGIEFVTPNLEFLKRSNIVSYLKGVVITHAHEDHLGGVHEIWPHFKFHVYVTKFAKEVLLNKLEGKTYKDELVQYYLHEIPNNGKFEIGDFKLEFLDITHSIPESNAVLITTPLGTILHTGDWKVDPGPVLGQPIDPKSFQKLADQKIMAMVCDSTNSILPGHSGSEKEVYDSLQILIGKITKGRIIASCFASNLARIKGLADAGFANGREVCLLGRSIDRMTEAAEKCRYPIHLDQFVTEDIARRLPPEKVMYIATGTQGDEKAALARIARGVHRSVQLSSGDTVIMSSKIIPGNERRVNIMFNDLSRIGVNIITEKQEKVHVSGHPYQEDLKQMYAWVKPEYLIPVHGEMLHLVEHAKFARKQGLRTLIPENGMLISLVRKKILRSYSISRWGFDGNRFIDMMSSIIKDRDVMGKQGCVFATLVMDKKHNHFLPDQSIISVHGLTEDSGEDLVLKIKNTINNLYNKPTVGDDDSAGKLESEAVRTPKVRDRISNIVRANIAKMPLISVHWIYV